MGPLPWASFAHGVSKLPNSKFHKRPLATHVPDLSRSIKVPSSILPRSLDVHLFQNPGEVIFFNIQKKNNFSLDVGGNRRPMSSQLETSWSVGALGIQIFVWTLVTHPHEGVILRTTWFCEPRLAMRKAISGNFLTAWRRKRAHNS